MRKISFLNKKVIVFDLDGTIVKLSVDWMPLKDNLVDKYKEIYKEQCDVKRISNCLTKIVGKNDESVLESFFDIIREYEFKNFRDTELIEDTIFFINNLDLFGIKKQAKLAILSLNTRNTIFKALELATISDKIDLIIGREDVRRWKPEPEGLLKIQNHYKVEKDKMIFFGDLDNDILTGKNAGVQAYLIGDLIDYVNLIKNNLKER